MCQSGRVDEDSPKEEKHMPHRRDVVEELCCVILNIFANISVPYCVWCFLLFSHRKITQEWRDLRLIRI